MSVEHDAPEIVSATVKNINEVLSVNTLFLSVHQFFAKISGCWIAPAAITDMRKCLKV